MLSYPLILVNFKSYKEALGNKAIELANYARKVQEETGITVGVAPQYIDLRDISKLGVFTFAQHADPIEPGSYTGHVTLESLHDAGVTGVIINHSEHKMLLSDINFIIKKARQLKLMTIVCADTIETSVAVSALKPDIVAIEPPELIGTGRAVSKVSPDIVRNAVAGIRSITKDVHILCGAGITNGDDVYAAIKLGTEGVLLASGVVKAEDPYKTLMEMAIAAKKAYEEKH
ncbi:MAG: triose-phosphate isomerase [Thermoprotei archaeon]